MEPNLCKKFIELFLYAKEQPEIDGFTYVYPTDFKVICGKYANRIYREMILSNFKDHITPNKAVRMSNTEIDDAIQFYTDKLGYLYIRQPSIIEKLWNRTITLFTDL